RSIRESGVFIAITSFIIPLLSGVALGRLLALPLGSSMFLGIALAFTALPVSIGILTDLELLETDFGRSIVSAGLLCDVAGLAMIGVVLNVSASAGFDPLAMGILVLRFAAFTGLLIAVDRLFRYRHGVLASWLLRASRHLVTKGAPFALPFIVALGFAFLADYLGLHFVVGAFFGTLLVAEPVIGDRDALARARPHRRESGLDPRPGGRSNDLPDDPRPQIRLAREYSRPPRLRLVDRRARIGRNQWRGVTQARSRADRTPQASERRTRT